MSKEIHKGRWGFYPCSYETYRKLKELNKLYTKALHQLADWKRWYRKQPQNRVFRCPKRNEDGHVIGWNTKPRPEPELHPLFLIKEKYLEHWFDGVYYKSGISMDRVNLSKHHINDDYYKARFPKQDKESVKPLSINLQMIDELYEKYCK